MSNQNWNLVLATVISVCIAFGWGYLFPPKQLVVPANASVMSTSNVSSDNVQILNNAAVYQSQSSSASIVDHSDEAKQGHVVGSPVLKIHSNKLSGSISLRGLRLDSLILKEFFVSTDPKSDNITLLSPNGTGKPYFVQFGWKSSYNDIILPNAQTIWQASSEELTPNNSVTLSWNNNNGLYFTVKLKMDDNYLINIESKVMNYTNTSVPLQFYGLVNRTYDSLEKSNNILHQGGIAVLNDQLKEVNFADMKSKQVISDDNVRLEWMGFSDKYWLTAFIPDKSQLYDAHFVYSAKKNRYQVDFASAEKVIAPDEVFVSNGSIFAGAKELNLLDQYEEKNSIRLFDRAVDFGMFYILTKPMLYALHAIYELVGNFGVSIMLMTVCVKSLMFAVTNKSYRTMKKMRALEPEINKIKSMYENDKLKMNQEVMSLHKKHNINPLSGCLPLVLQMPVFFSLYKVLYVSIEMRHAPFFGWIKDLSAPDPTSIFNLFGLLNISLPNFLMIGVWPILMTITMLLQQKLTPRPADPVQAQVTKFMPWVFLVMFAQFPAGLVIYWTWNNTLSILEQTYVNKTSS